MLDLLREQRSEISSLKSMILELSKRLSTINYGVLPVMNVQEQPQPIAVNRNEGKVLVETVESDSD